MKLKPDPTKSASHANARWSRQYEIAICSTNISSSTLSGCNCSHKLANWSAKASLASEPMTRFLDKIPCFTAFQRLWFLPADVFGPVDFWALSRLAATFAGEVAFDKWFFSALGNAVFRGV